MESAAILNYREFVQLAKHHKMAWVEATDRGDLTPTVVGIRDKKPVILVISPNVDKYEGLNAINMLRRGMAIDSVAIITDAHTMLTKGKSKEEVQRLYEKYAGKPGSMQKACDEEGACAHREIADCLSIQFMDVDGTFYTGSYPYDYHGKDGGVEFKWMEEHNTEMLGCSVVSMEEIERRKKSGEKIGDCISGFIPNNVKAIMGQPNTLESDDIKILMKAIGADPDNPEDRQRALFHMEVATRKALEDQNFMVMECVAYDGTFADFLLNMADKYEAILKAQEFEQPSKEEVMQLLVSMEKEADGDLEILEKVKQLREKVQSEL